MSSYSIFRSKGEVIVWTGYIFVWMYQSIQFRGFRDFWCFSLLWPSQKASYFKVSAIFDAFFFSDRREKHHFPRIPRFLMLFSSWAVVKGIIFQGFRGFWCFFLLGPSWKASHFKVSAIFDAFFFLVGREKHHISRFLRFLMLFSSWAIVKSIIFQGFRDFWCFFLLGPSWKASISEDSAVFDAFFFLGSREKHQIPRLPRFLMLCIPNILSMSYFTVLRKWSA